MPISTTQLFHAMMNDPESRASFYSAQTDEARVALIVRAGERTGLAVSEDVARDCLGLRRAAGLSGIEQNSLARSCGSDKGGGRQHEAR